MGLAGCVCGVLMGIMCVPLMPDGLELGGLVWRGRGLAPRGEGRRVGVLYGRGGVRLRGWDGRYKGWAAFSGEGGLS